MIFFFHTNAGEKKIILENIEYHSLVRVRRKKMGEKIELRNLIDEKKYEYIIVQTEKRKAYLELVSEKKERKKNINKKYFHLGWGICDAKTIYSTLPMLNQLGVSKISFVKCERSQGNISLSSEKIKNILISSCEQCGRNNIMEWEELSFDEFLKQNPETFICDFEGRKFLTTEKIETIFIGPEGGFSLKEKNKFPKENIRKFSGDTVLKSETACVIISGRNLL